MDWSGFLGLFSDTFKSALSWIQDTFGGVINWVLSHLKDVWGVVKNAFQGVLKFLKLLVQFKWRELWQLLKSAYDHLRRWINLIQRYVFGPIERMRRQIMQVYDTFFRPVLRVIENLRQIVRMIGIFDKQLAAKLDGALLSLEGKLMAPITSALKRLNQISSEIRATVTALGFLDRGMLVESLRRDASIIWSVLTNPKGRIYGAVKPAQPYSYSDFQADAHAYFTTGSGAVADYIAEAQTNAREVQQGVA